MNKSHYCYYLTKSEAHAKALGACQDALAGYPNFGTRIGHNHTARRPTTFTIANNKIVRHDGYFAILGPKHYAPLFPQYSTHEVETDLGVGHPFQHTWPSLPDRHWREDWTWFSGFYGEYLADLDPNLVTSVFALEIRTNNSNQDSVSAYGSEGENEALVDVKDIDQLCRLGWIDDDSYFFPIPRCYVTNFGRIAYFVSVKREQWDAYARIKGPRPDLSTLPSSFAEAYLLTLHAHVIHEYGGTHKHLGYTESQSEQFRRTCGQLFLSLVTYPLIDNPRSFHLFDALNAVSSRPYENRETAGVMMFCREDVTTDWQFHLLHPFPLSDVRQTRKLLEVSDNNVPLMTDTVMVFGTVNPPRSDAVFYVVDFDGVRDWKLLEPQGDANQCLMETVDRLPRIPSPKLRFSCTQATLGAACPTMNEDAVRAVHDVAVEAVEQRHGTLVVIVENANTEAARLGTGAYRMNTPHRLRVTDTKRVTKIDGAVLLDLNANCHAVGVILDGSATTDTEDPSRGARFNCAARYFSAMKKSEVECAILIVSEDGYAQWIPSVGSAPQS